jgi:hypothetical protein
MTPNQKLRAEADRRRDAFFETASSTAEHMRPAAVLDKLVGMLDPNLELLKHIESTAKRNPLAVLVAVGGLWLLARQMKRSGQQTKPATRRVMRPYRTARSTLKGDENGYINDAEQY